MTTGEKMRIRRKELGLTVDEVADRVGTTPDDLMLWNTLLEDIASYNERMDGVLPQIENGVSVAYGAHSYILLKTLNRGGHLGHDLQSLLSIAHRLKEALIKEHENQIYSHN